MKQYHDLVTKILNHGIHRDDRTGVGTTAIFGEQMRFDLSEGFPAITTKKLAWKAVVSELLWFIEGSGDENRLKEILHLDYDSPKPTIWSGNAQAAYWTPSALFPGDLGLVYGNMWRKWPASGKNIETIPIKAPEPTQPIEVEDLNRDFLKHQKPKKMTPLDSKIYQLWARTIRSCYDTPHAGSGASVSTSWQNFSTFSREIKGVAGFYRWAQERDFVLSPDYYGAGQFSKSTSLFIEKRHQREIKKNKFPSSATTIDRRVVYVDQLKNLIEGIKTNPSGRRHILSAWNPAELNNMGLPPCHIFCQFFVAGNKLSCQMYQRSQDVFLGNPFNIASYPLFLHMIAQVCDLVPGEYIHVMGDCHIYDNHIEAAKELLTRTPLPAPQLWLNPEIKDIDKFTMKDIELRNYQSHGAILAPMAV